MSGRKNLWTESQITTLRKMRCQGATIQEIADSVGRTKHSVSTFIKNHAHKYGIEVASRTLHNGDFDKEWHGVIPCGHWMITKAWGKKCDVKPVTSC